LETHWCRGPNETTKWADINGDGKADLICDANNGWHFAQLYLGNGRFKDLGTIAKNWCREPGEHTSWADINGDGKADMVCDGKNGWHWAKLSLGNGKFRDLGTIIQNWCRAPNEFPHWADINGDGKADILCDGNNGGHWALLSLGNGKFRDLGSTGNWRCRGDKVTYADLNGDGKADRICDDNGTLTA